MIFNSIEFAFFLPLVFILYWFVFNKHIRLQNAFLVLASYVFYGWWDWRFLGLICFSSGADFLIGLAMGRESDDRKRKLLLFLSIILNIGLLGVFKYYNFFINSMMSAFTFLGGELSLRGLRWVLPVGISFYTFQTLSYSIDVYRRKLEPTSDIVAFFAYVGFFPQLVAGPIERATSLLSQFTRKRVFDYESGTDACRQILWGLFKKIVIADNCAILVNDIFSNYDGQPGTTLFLGGMFFAFQIYGDFSGYSDIAIGTARLFGFNLKQNFAFPYFSRDMSEFWRRWHISLSTWFRDYVYIPLGGSRVNKWKLMRNVFAIFVISGFWHGANFTFIFWGIINAIFVLPLMLFDFNRNNINVVAENRIFPNIKEVAQILFTFFVTVIAWIYFRSPSITAANDYIFQMFANITEYDKGTIDSIMNKVWFFIILMFAVEWYSRRKQYGLQFDKSVVPPYLRWSFYFSIILIISFFGATQQEFIYFQF